MDDQTEAPDERNDDGLEHERTQDTALPANARGMNIYGRPISPVLPMTFRT